VLDSTKARLLNYSMLAACLVCGWYGIIRVGEVYELKCPRCGSADIGVVRVVKSDNLEREIRRNYDEIKRTAEILRKYGWTGLYALASRLPIDAVEELLASLNGVDLNELTGKIQEMEKEYLKQRLLE